MKDEKKTKDQLIKELKKLRMEDDEKFSKAFHNNPSIIGITRLKDGEYIDVNNTFERKIGYSREEAIGRTSTDLGIFTNPDDRKKLKRLLEKHGSLYNQEFDIHSKSGEIMKTLFSAEVIEIKGEKCLIASVEDITSRKQAEEELQKLASIVRYSSELMNLSTLDGKMIFLNEAGSKMLGIEPDEVEQTNIMEVIPDHLIDLVQKSLLPALMDNRTWEGDLQYRNIKTGKLTDVHAMTFTIQDQTTGKPLYLANVSFDITDRKQAEEVIRESEETMRVLLNAPKDTAMLFEADGTMLAINDIGAKRLGKNIDEIIGKSINDYLPPDLAKTRLESGYKVVTSGKPLHFEDERAGKTYENSVYPIFDKDRNVVRLAVFVRDITDRKQIEEELANYRERLEGLVEERTKELETAHMKLLTREKFAALGKATAMVSHEIRNPLSVIRAALYSLSKMIQGKVEGADETLDRVERNIARCDFIIEEMLDFTRIQNLNPEPVNINEWLEQALDELEIPENINLIRNLNSDSVIAIDQEHLHQCLVNIINNAWQAMDEGDEQYTKKEETDKKNLTIESGIDGTRLEIIIKDTGSGISPDEMKKIFEPLYSTKETGIGLGMPRVKQVMEQHGGGIEVESIKGKGTEVKLWLPVSE